MSTDKESSAAGTDNRPPMLVESDYESWKIRIERYIRGKTLGKLIWRSIQNEPTSHPQITMTEGQGKDAVQVTRDKWDEEFTEIKNNKELADIQATNILTPYDQAQWLLRLLNMFEVSLRGTAYDSDVDEGPHVAAAFMANLSSTSGTNGATTSQVNKAELADANKKMVSLERNKVKHDLDQTIIQRNKQNVELEEENVLLK
ncbi:hypothetical protein Tco_0019512 [Tanacetum coccineum]